MLKKTASGVLSRSASSLTCMYAPGASLPAALLDGFSSNLWFESHGLISSQIAYSDHLKRVFQQLAKDLQALFQIKTMFPTEKSWGGVNYE